MTQVAGPLDLGLLSDAELLNALRGLVRADRASNARLLVHLGEVDARGLFRDEAYSSMIEYAIKALRMSGAEAFLRINAARLGRRFPLVVEMLGRGELHLTAIKLLAPHLTSDNHVQVLERARCKTKREVELLIAEIAPRPDVQERVRRVPEVKGKPTSKAAEPPKALDLALSLAAAQAGTAAAQVAHASTAVAQTSTPVAQAGTPVAHAGTAVAQAGTAVARAGAFALESPVARASITPLRPGRFKLELTLGQEAYDQLRQLRELLRHQIPSGDLASVLERAVAAFHEQTMQRRFAKKKASHKPRVIKRKASPAKARSRYIPRAVVREVHERDGGQCSFVSKEGQRCDARSFLELHHHDVPFARGGASTPENLRLMCRVHNALLAERDYGRSFIQTKRRANPLVPDQVITNVL